jgi:predicted dehydrogenase
MTGLRWGILGTGGIAHLFTSDLKLEGFDVRAVGSRSQDSADAFASSHGIGRAYSSYEQLVADDEVDVIYVSTPHPFHAENATLALEAGKHVLVEKPFTINASEAQSVVDLAASRKLVVLEAMWTRWLPHMVRIRELIASGVLGDVRTVLADHDQKLSSDPAHRMQAPSLGGGALLDLGIYPVSFAWDVFGAPTSVQALSSPTATGVDRQTAILLGYGDGQQAVLHTALDTRGPNKAAVIGTEARIEIDPVWYTPTSFTVYDPSETVIERYESSVQGRGMQFQASALEAIVLSGEGSGRELSPEQSVGIMGTLDEIRRQIGLRYPSE